MQILRLSLGAPDSLAVAICLTVWVFLMAYFPKMTGVEITYVRYGLSYVENVSTRLGGGVRGLLVMAVVFGVGVYVLARLMGLK